MISAQVVEMSVTNNSSFQNYTHLDDHTIWTTEVNDVENNPVALQYSITLIQQPLCLLVTIQGTGRGTLWGTLVSSVLQIMFTWLLLKFTIK